MQIYNEKEQLDKEKYKMPHVRRTGAVEGLMEQSQVLKEINCLKNCLIHLGQGQVLTLPEGKSCVPLSFFV